MRTRGYKGLVLACALGALCTSAPARTGEGDSPKRSASRALAANAEGDGIAVEAPDDVRRAVDELRARGATRVRVARRTGRVAAAFGDLGALDTVGSGDAKTDLDGAVAFLASNAKAVGIDDPARDLALERRVSARGATHYVFSQRAAGLRVFDAETAVHVDAHKRVRALTNGFIPGIDPGVAAVRPALDAEAASAAAQAALGGDASGASALSGPELGIAPVGTGRLAWRVTVETREPVGAWETFVDAADGSLVGEPRSAAYFEARARVFVPNAVVATGDTSLTDQGNSSVAVPDSAYTPVAFGDLAAGKAVDGTYCSTSKTTDRLQLTSADVMAMRRGDRGFNELEAYWAIDYAQRYMREELNVLDAAAYQIPIDAYYDPSGTGTYDNSIYMRNGDGTGFIRFGTGGVDDAQDAEIVWHEYGHAILDSQRPNISGSEGAAIHEGWGDYVAATLSTTVAGDVRFHATVGEWDATAYDRHDPPYLRRVDGTKRYPADLHGEEHDDGELWSACLWDLHQTLGREAADPVIFNANFLFPRDVTFEDAAAAVLESDRILNGGANAHAITTAFARHGLDATGGAMAVASVKYTTSDGTPKLVVDGANFPPTSFVEIDGVALSKAKFPRSRVEDSRSTRIVGTDPNLKRMLRKGATVRVTVYNPITGERTAPFEYTRGG